MCVKYSHRLGITTADDARLEPLMNSISWATRERRNSIEFQSRHIKLSIRWNSRNQCNKWLFQIFISVISAKSHLWKAIKIKVFTAHKLQCLLCWSISSRHIAKKKRDETQKIFFWVFLIHHQDTTLNFLITDEKSHNFDSNQIRFQSRERNRNTQKNDNDRNVESLTISFQWILPGRRT